MWLERLPRRPYCCSSYRSLACNKTGCGQQHLSRLCIHMSIILSRDIEGKCVYFTWVCQFNAQYFADWKKEKNHRIYSIYIFEVWHSAILHSAKPQLCLRNANLITEYCSMYSNPKLLLYNTKSIHLSLALPPFLRMGNIAFLSDVITSPENRSILLFVQLDPIWVGVTEDVDSETSMRNQRFGEEYLEPRVRVCVPVWMCVSVRTVRFRLLECVSKSWHLEVKWERMLDLTSCDRERWDRKSTRLNSSHL